MIVGAVLGILAGLVAAVYRGRWIDKILTPLTYIGICIPVFWLGILMIYLLRSKTELAANIRIYFAVR